MENALKGKGLQLNYGRGVRMPANYVMSYNPADSGKSDKRLDKTDSRVRSIAAEIAAGAQSVKTLPVTANILYKDIANLDARFLAGDGCTGCGICERICPVANILLQDGRPTWLHHCEHCAACISWCPAKSIDYGTKTQARRRYRNSRIMLDELMPSD